MDLVNLLDLKSRKFKERIDWKEYFMSLAFLVSMRSSCARLHVGAVIVKDRRIVSSGYNGFLAGLPHESIIRDNHEMATVHAEQNCITDCAKRGVSVSGASIYITHFPCIHCTKFILSSGIKEVYYHNDYKNDPISTLLLQKSSILIKKI
jgi:dCMP deaminase